MEETPIRCTAFTLNFYDSQSTIKRARIEFEKPVSQREARQLLQTKNLVADPLYSTIEGKEQLTALPSPVHHWFELSYANYLTIPRSVLEAMPTEWQERFVELMEQLDDTIDWRPEEGTRYRVELCETVDDSGREVEWGEPISDPYANYRHPPKMKFKQ